MRLLRKGRDRLRHLGRTRLRTALLFLALLLALPEPAGAEGVLRQPPLLPDGSPPLYSPRHPCAPGQNATDPDCSQARRNDCLAGCRHEFKYNGDMMYLRWCERECGE